MQQTNQECKINISVIMSNYNTKKEYLHEAIKSILDQTYKNFELIIIDDGSSSENLKEIYKFVDERIKVFVNDKNRGLSYSLNKAIAMAKGKYIARMDTDDIAVRDRLEKQKRYLDENPQCDILGTRARIFGDTNKKFLVPSDNDEIKGMLFLNNSIVHPTVMFKKESFVTNGIKYSDQYSAEDYNLWVECAFKYNLKFHNLKEILLKYRMHEQQITITKKIDLQNCKRDLYQKILMFFNIHLSKTDLDIYCKFANGNQLEKNEFKKIELIVARIIKENIDMGILDNTKLQMILSNKLCHEIIRHFIFYRINYFSLLKRKYLLEARRLGAKEEGVLRVLLFITNKNK